LSSTTSRCRLATCSARRSLSDLPRTSGTASDAFAVLQRREVDEPDAVGERAEVLARQLLGEARLAAATDAAERDQARVGEQPGAIGERGLAADEPAPRLRQVGARRGRLLGSGLRRCIGPGRSGEPIATPRHRRDHARAE
jgi:hypothetical protein